MEKKLIALFCTRSKALQSLSNGHDFFSTEAVAGQKGKPSLYDRIALLGNSQQSAVPAIQEWINEGNKLPKTLLERIIKKLCKYERYKHALEVSEWMDSYGRMRLGMSDHALRLDLIEKVHGLDCAEKYFSQIPERGKCSQTYSALLNGYVKKGLVDKAEQVAEKMKELKLLTNAVPYNNMMTLYYKSGQPEKVPLLIEEMKEKDIVPDAFTYIIWMRSAAALSGIRGAERVFHEMKRDGRIKKDWTAYSNLASVYLDTKNSADAQNALKVMEVKMSPKDILPHDFLLITYAGLNKLAEVHRVWQLIRERFPKIPNNSYICLLKAIVKLGDIQGAEKYFEDWESKCTVYDIRVSNILIEEYINKEQIEKAEALLQRAIDRKGKPIYKTWDIFLAGYLKKKQMNLAVETMKKALAKVKYPSLEPDPEKALAILKHFEESCDVYGAEDMFERLKRAHFVTVDTYNALIRTYIRASKSPARVIERMELDKIVPNAETHILTKQIKINKV